MAKRKRETIRPRRPLPKNYKEVPEYWRPQDRSDCAKGPRPCPYMGCRYHLALEHRRGLIILPFGRDVDLEALEHTCALDVADKGEHSGYQIADLLGLSRQRVTQLEQSAAHKLRQALKRLQQEAKEAEQSIAD